MMGFGVVGIPSILTEGFFMQIVKVTIVLPYCPRQDVIVYQKAKNYWRLSLVDRFDRRINFTGEYIGFGIRVFKSSVDMSYLVVKNEFDTVLYKSNTQDLITIDVLNVETDDY